MSRAAGGHSRVVEGWQVRPVSGTAERQAAVLSDALRPLRLGRMWLLECLVRLASAVATIGGPESVRELFRVAQRSTTWWP